LDTDLDLLAELGVGAYRFSIAWTRVHPTGAGEVNPAGIAFYLRLVDGLRERGIEAWPTLYHWDLPQALQDRGGWRARETVEAFETYTATMAAALGDRVDVWLTINEPWVAAFLGHLYGVFAPGEEDWGAALAAAHHLLLAHGRAVARIRDSSNARVGVAIDCRPARPASSSAEDLAATRYFDGFRNRWFFDPVFGRGYPEDVMRAYVARGRLDARPDFVHPGDMDEVSRPIDLLGLNYYTTSVIGAGQEETDDAPVPPGSPAIEGHTEMGWLIDPGGLRDYLVALDQEYGPRSIVVTENGASYNDAPGPDGMIHDTRRIDYLDTHIDAVMEARSLGVPVDGYLVWSLLDNLEWTSGFSQRFGLVWVDHQTQERVPKDSFHWYRRRMEAAQRPVAEKW
jgi:beta-glucosidase